MRRYKGISPAQFFKENAHIAGFQNPTRAVYQAVRELVENALDATDTHGILPDIRVTIAYEDRAKAFVRVTVSDNGIGVPASVVPKAFGTVLFSSKYVLRQTRGVFGLGVKMAVLYAQMTTGRPVEVTTSPVGEPRTHYFKIRIDVKRNEPVVLEHRVRDEDPQKHYTTVSLVIEGDWGRARSKVVEYLRRTHVVCPYAQIYARYPEGDRYSVLRLPRVVNRVPPPPREMLPHPHGIDLDTFNHMISVERPGTTVIKFLVRRFSGVGEKSAREFLKAAGVSPRKKVKGLSHEERVKLVKTMKTFRWRPPPATALSPAGEDLITSGLRAEYSPEFVAAVTRPPSAHGGHPFIVEAGLAYGGGVPESETPILLRFANKIPLLYDEGVDVARKVVDGIDWGSYGVQFPARLVVVTHIVSTRIPFHGLGKEAVADVPEIEKEIRLAVQELGRRLRRHVRTKEAAVARVMRRINISKYFPQIASALSIVGYDESLIIKKLEELLGESDGEYVHGKSGSGTEEQERVREAG